MRKFAIALALSTTVLAGPALARDGAFYVGGDFGPMIVEDADVPFATGTVNLGFETGFDGAGFVGYDLGAFRLEAEVAYKQADLEDINAPFALPGGARAGLRDAGGGEVTALSFMVNGLLDFGDEDGISGFIGGGVGVARVDFDNLRAFANQGSFLDDSDTRFAYQGIAGVRAALGRNVDVTLRYRFFNVEDLELAGFRNNAVEVIDTRFRSHSILGGLTFNFGVPEPVIECLAPNFLDANGVCVAPPPPPPPPVDPIVTCPPPPQSDGRTQVPQSRLNECPPVAQVPVGPFIVYFGWDQDELTAQARGILDTVAEAHQRGGQPQVVLAGHADRSGSDRYNVGLSQRRANNVREYLASRGVPAGAVNSQAFGESRPAVDTADGVREPDNRRVEITFGPGSGF